MQNQTLCQATAHLSASDPMPVLFLGHGSPMNAIEENEFVEGFRKVSSTIEKPQAILCISAHWETRGTQVTAMANPRTIHDFGGFPKALFEVQYPAPGSPMLAREVEKILDPVPVGMDQQWGLDHGAWSVLKHLYPEADVPVIQLSLDYTKGPRYHYELARQLAALRHKGVLVVGSGNLVHNLRLVAWDRLQDDNYAYDWALEASENMKYWLQDGDHERLIRFEAQGKAFQLAIPTPEHYLPLLYVLGLQDKTDQLSLFNDKAVGGSLTMTSVRLNPLR
jgi:4,5-DOPA dioxygenase extradiol